jgi:glutathione S-transferase
VVRFLLHEMNLPYQLELVDRKANFQKSAQYLKLNPAGRIPTLIDGELVLFESPAICIYLCEQCMGKGLIPELGTPDRALFFQWLTFLNNTLQAELMIYHYPQKHTDSKQAITSIIRAQEKRIAESMLIIDQQLQGKKYLLGDYITACDFFLFMLAGWALKLNKSPLSFTNLGNHLKKLAKHPSIVEVCKEEGINLQAFQ